MRRYNKSWHLLLWVVLFALLLVLLVFASPVLAQASETALYTFEDGKEISIRYIGVFASQREGVRLGKLWTPGGYPMLLFTAAKVSVGNSEIPAGAYSMFLIPGREEWLVVVNGNVTSGSKYDQREDVLRARMQTGELGQEEKQLRIYFGRVGPKKCDMRLDYGRIRAWIEFEEK
jgi:hypothetical protein